MLLAELADAAGDAEFGQERGEKEGGRVVSGMKKIKVRGR